MIDINGWEIVIIVVLVLLVFGPERLPEFLFRAGQLIRQFRRMTDEATSEITREFRAAAELAESEIKAPLAATLADAKAPFDDLSASLTAATTLQPLSGKPTEAASSDTASEAAPPVADVGELAATEPEPLPLPADLPSIAPPGAPYPPLFDGPTEPASEASADATEATAQAPITEDPDAA